VLAEWPASTRSARYDCTVAFENPDSGSGVRVPLEEISKGLFVRSFGLRRGDGVEDDLDDGCEVGAWKVGSHSEGSAHTTRSASDFRARLPANFLDWLRFDALYFGEREVVEPVSIRRAPSQQAHPQRPPLPALSALVAD